MKRLKSESDAGVKAPPWSPAKSRSTEIGQPGIRNLNLNRHLKYGNYASTKVRQPEREKKHIQAGGRRLVVLAQPAAALEATSV